MCNKLSQVGDQSGPHLFLTYQNLIFDLPKPIQLSLVLHLPTLSLFIVKSSGQENQKMGKSNIIYTTAVNMACHQHQQTQGAAPAVVDPILPFHLTNKQMGF